MSNLSVNANIVLGIMTIKIKTTQVIQVWLWERLRWLTASLQNNFISTPHNQIGLRDTALFSAGHGSMLLYALFFTSGFLKMSMDERLRVSVNGVQTPVVTQYLVIRQGLMLTGPLGQGISTATGFAQAERFFWQPNNREGYNIFDLYTYVICGDAET